MDSSDQPLIEAALLRDGTAVTLRWMQPSDGERLVRFHARLSLDTTYLRHFAMHPELTPAEVTRFTNVDHEQREAIVAIVADEIVGVARFDREDEPGDAEVAFVVADEWCGRGLGSAMFRQLVQRARQLGVAAFTAQTFPYNARMLAVFAHSGWPHVASVRDGVVDVRIELPRDDR